jgi:hypothetical protein
MVKPGGSLLVVTMRGGHDPQVVKDLPPGCPAVSRLLDFCYKAGQPHTLIPNSASKMNCSSTAALQEVVGEAVPPMPAPRVMNNFTIPFEWLKLKSGAAVPGALYGGNGRGGRNHPLLM